MNSLHTPTALLRELARRGVTLEVHGQRLKFEARNGASAVEDLLPDLRRLKVSLIQLLQRAQQNLDKGNPDMLLVHWRSRGVYLELEEIEVAGSSWLALTYVVPAHLWSDEVKGELERDRQKLREALEKEAL